jgi:copper chaperone CopZ
MTPFANLLGRLGIQRTGSTRGGTAAAGSVTDVEYRIPNLVCEGCAEKIEGSLRSIAGVHQVRANVGQKRILVRYEPERVRPEQLEEAVKRAGFTAVEA